MYLESFLKEHPNAIYLFTECQIEKDKKSVITLKKTYKNWVGKIWDTEEFKSLKDQTGDDVDKGLGMHLPRKFSAHKSKSQGPKVEQTEYRGCWLGDKG